MAPKPMSTSTGWASLSLCIARVTMVYWEEMRCDIEIFIGEDNRPKYSGVELLMPSIGARHFLGAIPMVGDHCVCGWFVSNSDGEANKKSPAILAWLPKASYLGHEWVPTQDFSIEEGIQNTPKDRIEGRAVMDRLRHKLRHYEPGNVGATSAQGADIHLDESVLISNRRANEIVLRDQDQALVTRSLQQFHNMAGARVYGGMIQRDARSLPKEMFVLPEDYNQEILYSQGEFAKFLSDPNRIGILNPNPLFKRDEEGLTDFERLGGFLGQELNPYYFLYKSKLLDPSGRGLHKEAEVYGGKSILRVNKEGDFQSESDTNALVEYRIDVCHTSDGTLPVNEETDGFDADRLLNPKTNLPYIEMVLGTPVGNDPYTDKGIEQYGRPLYLNLTEKGGALENVSPQIPLEDQLATMLSVKPLDQKTAQTVSGYTKTGAFRSYIGSTIQDALKARIEGGMSLVTGDRTEISSSAFTVRTESSPSAPSLVLESAGAVSIVSRSYVNTGDIEDGGDLLPLNKVGTLIDSYGSIKAVSSTGVQIASPVFEVSEATEVTVNALNNMEIESGDNLTLTAKIRKDTITGKQETIITGPPDFNPTYGAVRETTIGANPATGFPAGVVDKYTCAYGDRTETYLSFSNVSTTIATGSHNTTVAIGSINHTAGLTSISQSVAGVAISTGAGNISLSTALGVVSVSSTISVGIRSLGATTVSGATVVLGAPGAGIGMIMCDQDRDPTTGKTFLETGLMLPRGQLLAPSIL